MPKPNNDGWRTPHDLCVDLGEFDLDPCAGKAALVWAKERYVWPVHDGLRLPWRGSVFCNPPYSDPRPWCDRLAAHDGPWVALLKLDPTTQWWAALIASGPTWAPFRKRLRFEPPLGWKAKPMTANFASVLVWKDWTPPVALNNWLWMPRRG